MKPCISLEREVCALVGSGGSWAIVFLSLLLVGSQRTCAAQDATDPLDVWKHRLNAPSVRGMTFGDGLFVARDYSGTNVHLSRNGATWATHRIGTNVLTPFGAAFGNGRFVMCGYEGFAMSTNGTNWSYSRPGGFFWGWDVLFADGRFLAAGFIRDPNLTRFDSGILSSTDGLNWTTRLYLTNAELRGIAYGDGVYVASGPCNSNLGSNSCIVSVLSTNGDDWYRVIGPPLGPPSYNYNIAYGNGTFVAAGLEVYAGTVIRTSSMPEIRWTRVVEPARWNATIFEAAFYDGTFVIGGDGGLLATSPDGTNWTRRDPKLQGTVLSSAFGYGRLLAGGGGISQSEAFTPFPPLFLRDPADALLRNGGGYTNQVVVEGGPFTLQWRVDGQNLPGATNSTLKLSGVTHALAGEHTVVATSVSGSSTSAVGRVTVADACILRQQPLSLAVPSGSTVTLSVRVDGTPPVSYRWRKNGQTILHKISDRSTDFLVVSNVTTSAYYEVIVSNIVRFPGELSQRAQVTVLDDSDRDGLPDDFESANQLDPHDASDAQLDSDGDGISNANEYLAGTDPKNPDSFLRIERISAEAGARVHFNAAAGKTYTIQYTDSLSVPDWKRLTDLAASASGGAISVGDPDAGGRRFYRLMTPGVD